MSAAAFLDTNIFCYTKDSSDPQKHIKAVRLVEDLVRDGRARLSTQVISEFYVFLKRAAANQSELVAARITAQSLTRLSPVPITAELQLNAWELEGRYQISWWDALIVAAAKSTRCEVLYSEDLQHGQNLGGVIVVDPFVPFTP